MLDHGVQRRERKNLAALDGTLDRALLLKLGVHIGANLLEIGLGYIRDIQLMGWLRLSSIDHI